MTTLREAAQQALEAMRCAVPTGKITLYEWDKAVSDLDAALAEPVQDHFPDATKMVHEPGVWTPVTDALPQSGVKVLACYRNRLGNLRRIRAMWTAAKTEEASSEDAEACSEYDEATDTYYVTEGWYECIDNWGDYSSVAVTEGEVTHWMPLPPDPDSAPPAAAGTTWEDQVNNMTQPAPMRAVRLTLKLDADDMRELGYALRNLADHAERGELTSGVSGGPCSGYIYELLQDPTMTHDAYHAALRAYLDERRQAVEGA